MQARRGTGAQRGRRRCGSCRAGRAARVQGGRAGAREVEMGGMPISAGGGEAPDRRAEGLMSRPAGEALPQHPRPRPHRWCRHPGRWAWGTRPQGPRHGSRAPRQPRLPRAVRSSARASGPIPGGSRRSAPRRALGRAAPRPSRSARPAPARPAPPPPRQPRGRAGGRGGAEPGLRACQPRSVPPDRAAGPRAPRAPRRRLLLSPPPADREPHAPGPRLCH